MRDVIIACDFENRNQLMNFLTHLKDERPFLKIGMELFYKEGPSLVKELKEKGYPIFLDLKLHDIPTTVKKAIKNIGILGVDIINVHAAGGVKMMTYAKEGLEEVGSSAKLIAVTQLTSTSDEMLQHELLITTPMDQTVAHYAKNAKEAGLDGVVCSPLEAKAVGEMGLISVTPGIRFANHSTNDQVRVATPKDAKTLGSTYIVVGRSITQSEHPREAYQKCIKEFV